MANRTRPIRIPFDVTQEEKEIILANMNRAGFTSVGAYARKMLIDGYVITIDYKEIKELTGALGMIGSNVNQIARRANETHRITETDILEVHRLQNEITSLLRQLLLKIK